MSASYSYLLQSLGLLSDIVGAILLFRFGLPVIERTGGAQRIIMEELDEEALAKERSFDFWGRIGLTLLLLGFALQLVPNFVGWWNS